MTRTLKEQLADLVLSGVVVVKKRKPAPTWNAPPAKTERVVALREPELDTGLTFVDAASAVPLLGQPTAPLTKAVPVPTAKLHQAVTALRTTIIGTDDAATRLLRARVLARETAEAVAARLKYKNGVDDRRAVASARWIANAVQSLHEANASADLDRRTLKNTRGLVLGRLADVVTHLEGASATVVESTSLADLPVNHFSKYLKYRAKFPGVADKRRMTVVRCPVIALFSRPVRAADLDAEGFEVTADGDYIVLHDQDIWCVNQRVLAADETWEGDEQGYIEKMMTSYERKHGGTKVVLAGAEGKQRIGNNMLAGFSLYWALPRASVEALGAPVREWGLPFGKETRPTRR